MTRARVHVRRRDHQAIRADPGRVADSLRGEAVQVRGDLGQIGDDEGHALARPILEQQRTRVQVHPPARRAPALRAVARESDAGRRRDVGPTEARPEPGCRDRS